MTEKNLPGRHRCKQVTSFLKVPLVLLNKTEMKTRPSLSASRVSGSGPVKTASLRSQISPFFLFPAPLKGLKTPGMPRMRRHQCRLMSYEGMGSQSEEKEYYHPHSNHLSQLHQRPSTSLLTPTSVGTWRKAGFFQSPSFPIAPLWTLPSAVGKETGPRVINAVPAPHPGGWPKQAEEHLNPISSLRLLKKM